MLEGYASDLVQIRLDDVLISHRRKYHCVVDSNNRDEIHFTWLKRLDEQIYFYPYHRVRKLAGILSHCG
jgi:hypothetical protein